MNIRFWVIATVFDGRRDVLVKNYMNTIWKIYFSATGTTKKVIDCIGDELANKFSFNVLTYDFTLPEARLSFPKVAAGDLVVFGVPTYAGRVPNLLLKYLDTIAGNGALAVPVVTFGNRAFDNSLIELRNILESHGFRTVAAAAFSCEHSFSFTLAAGRPDADDISSAKSFAEHIYNKVSKTDFKATAYAPVKVDGDEPAGYYQPKTDEGTPIDIRKVKPKTNTNCTKCGTCAKVCPMGSISFEDFSIVSGVCVKCGACIKKCPAHAKYFDDAGYLYHKEQLERNFQRPAGNIFFI